MDPAGRFERRRDELPHAHRQGDAGGRDPRDGGLHVAGAGRGRRGRPARRRLVVRRRPLRDADRAAAVRGRVGVARPGGCPGTRPTSRPCRPRRRSGSSISSGAACAASRASACRRSAMPGSSSRRSSPTRSAGDRPAAPIARRRPGCRPHVEARVARGRRGPGRRGALRGSLADHGSRHRRRARPVHASLVVPEGTSFGDTFALSPDGRRLAFEAWDKKSGTRALWLRELDSGKVELLAQDRGRRDAVLVPRRNPARLLRRGEAEAARLRRRLGAGRLRRADAARRRLGPGRPDRLLRVVPRRPLDRARRGRRTEAPDDARRFAGREEPPLPGLPARTGRRSSSWRRRRKGAPATTRARSSCSTSRPESGPA